MVGYQKKQKTKQCDKRICQISGLYKVASLEKFEQCLLTRVFETVVGGRLRKVFARRALTVFVFGAYSLFGINGIKRGFVLCPSASDAQYSLAPPLECLVPSLEFLATPSECLVTPSECGIVIPIDWRGGP